MKPIKRKCEYCDGKGDNNIYNPYFLTEDGKFLSEPCKYCHERGYYLDFDDNEKEENEK